MMSYRIAFALICIGIVFSGIQESGLYSTVTLPHTGVVFSQSDAESMASAGQNEGLNAFMMLSIAVKCGRVILTGLATAFTILPLMLYYLPPKLVWIAMIFQAPIYFVYAVDAADWWRGTHTPG